MLLVYNLMRQALVMQVTNLIAKHHRCCLFSAQAVVAGRKKCISQGKNQATR